MAQQHLDRLTSTDASFLHQEGPASHMHIGAVLLFEGPPPAFPDYLEHVRGRLHLVPRYRHKLATPPFQTGRPMWVDDPTFNLDYHVRHTALPAPGNEDQLLRLAGRIASQRLDRSKPLWENWLVEGLDDGRFALIFKTHHALVDGVAGVDLATVLLDLEKAPGSPSADAPEEESWRPHPSPTPADLVVAGARGFVSTGLKIMERAIEAAADPAATAAKLAEAAEGIGELVWAGLNPAPETPLNVPIGPHRRFTVVRQELDQYREVKNKLGGTVNDVVLTVVAGALARWFRSRGVRTEGLQLRALVPVSVRTRDQRHTLGNQLAAMRGPLPIYISDPVARLRHVSRAMDGLKESKQAVAATTLARVNNLAPPTILAQASRLQFSTRLFNLIVTNIPGPQFPLYVLGRQLRDLFPVAFLPSHHALAVAIMSYDGGIDYGLLADYDAVPDVDLIAEGIDEALAELLKAARSAGGSRPRGRGRVSQRRAAASSAGARAGKPKRTSDAADRTDMGSEVAEAAAEDSRASILPTQASRPKQGPAADMRARRARSGTQSQRGGTGGGSQGAGRKRPPGANGGAPQGADAGK